MQKYPEHLEPQHLFEVLWETAAARYYDRERLGDWEKWRSMKDSVSTEEDAIKAARAMVYNLDKFNWVEKMVPITTPTEPTADAKEAPVGATEPVVTGEWLTEQIGYLKIAQFNSTDVPDAVQAELEKFAGADGIILDLRDNPGGSLPAALGTLELLLPSGKVAAYLSRNGDVTYLEFVELTEEKHYTIFVATEPSGEEKAGERELDRYPCLMQSAKLVVLVNSRTASVAELIAAALQENGRAIVIGEQTVGKGIMQETIPMPNGVALTLSVIRYVTPNCKWLGDAGQTVGDGIQPDVHVSNISASDDQLACAIQCITDSLLRSSVHVAPTV